MPPTWLLVTGEIVITTCACLAVFVFMCSVDEPHGRVLSWPKADPKAPEALYVSSATLERLKRGSR